METRIKETIVRGHLGYGEMVERKAFFAQYKRNNCWMTFRKDGGLADFETAQEARDYVKHLELTAKK